MVRIVCFRVAEQSWDPESPDLASFSMLEESKLLRAGWRGCSRRPGGAREQSASQKERRPGRSSSHGAQAVGGLELGGLQLAAVTCTSARHGPKLATEV